jgi:hypothetical protein
MLTLSSIVWTALAFALISFWWQGDMIKRHALQHLYQYFREQDLQLLDQTIVLKGVWPRRNEFGHDRAKRSTTAAHRTGSPYSARQPESPALIARLLCIPVP